MPRRTCHPPPPSLNQSANGAGGLTRTILRPISERVALDRLAELAHTAAESRSAKFDALVKHLKHMGFRARATDRVVVFAERVATLNWLTTAVAKDLKLAPEQVTVLHGGLSDKDQQDIVDSFKLESSPTECSSQATWHLKA